MDPESGRIARLMMENEEAERVKPGDHMFPGDVVPADKESAAVIQEMLDRAEAEGRDPAPLVAIEEPVVQRLRLGDKELRRRRQRRR